MFNHIIWNNAAGYYGGHEIHNDDDSHPEISYCDIMKGWNGSRVHNTSGSSVVNGGGNINAEPLFMGGPGGDYYLSQTTAGQPVNSPCLDTGNDLSDSMGMDYFTTRTDGVADVCIVDIGYHYNPGYFVDDDAPNDPCHWNSKFSDPLESGSSEHPFDSIQKALEAAEGRGYLAAVVTVLDGLYSGIGNYDIEPNGLLVKIRSQNGLWRSIIDCNSQGRGFIFQNGECGCVVVDGFTIIDGYSSQCGAGVYCYDSSPTIRNCMIIGNDANWAGGGIFLEESYAEIDRCKIIANYCETSGASLCTVGGSPTAKNCIIAWNFGYFSGGASSVYDSNLAIINCTIADNFASDIDLGTGGVQCWDADAAITNSILWQNYSVSGDQNQIGLHYGDETVTALYNDIQMQEVNDVWPGIGNINDDPLFALPEFGDYHLKSAVGRWDPIFHTNGDFNNDGIVDVFDLKILARFWLESAPAAIAELHSDDHIIDLADFAVFAANWQKRGENAGEWVADSVTSPCIDAGDTSDSFEKEPEPNGGRINMGTYGNTEEASKSP